MSMAMTVAPLAAACDAEERYPVELFSRMGALGYLGMGFPEELGGSGGCKLDYAILCEELAYGSGGIALGIYVHHVAALIRGGGLALTSGGANVSWLGAGGGGCGHQRGRGSGWRGFGLGLPEARCGGRARGGLRNRAFVRG